MSFSGPPGSPEHDRSVMALAPSFPTFSLERTPFDENYRPLTSTRITTNFANLARGENRQENLRNTIAMINNRFNDLARWDNDSGDRYSIELDIISVSVDVGDAGDADSRFPLIEVLQTHIVDHRTGQRTAGIVGNNFSSYVRDYDFSILLPAYNADRTSFSTPEGFGDLHGNLFTSFLRSDAYADHFPKAPVICLSVSSTKTYHRTDNHHPVLGVEYRQSEDSLTDQYFARMGLRARYFLPPRSAAPLAFYFQGDLLSDYEPRELLATVATMESFQKIYRPEIYNANAAAAATYRPSLTNPDYSTTRVVYDRDERTRLAVEQGRFAAEAFVAPHRAALEDWSRAYSAERRAEEGTRS